MLYFLALSDPRTACDRFHTVHFFVGRTLQRMSQSGGMEAMGRTGLLYNGPSAIRMESVNDDGATIRVQGRAGVDARRAMDWEQSSVIGQIQQGLTRWAVRQTNSIDIDATSYPVSFCDEHRCTSPNDTFLYVDVPKVNTASTLSGECKR